MQLLSASVDGVVKIWSLAKEKCLNTWEMHEGKIWAMEVHEDKLITGGSDSSIRIWLDNTE